MARVFISYASEDLASAREVHRWLNDAGHEVFLGQDSRDGIVVGEQWRQRLLERLRWADAVVCVVTSASVVSSWCTAEIVMAQARGSRLLPLRAEPDADHPLLADVPHIDLARDPAVACIALVSALRRVDAAGGAGWPDDRSPFPGLRPFESDQHRVFFGRADEIKALTELVRSAVEGTALVVVGPSGCGKSSLVRAGLLPVMAAEPGWRTLPPILPGADPVGALARELAAAARRIGLDWTVEQVERRLDGGGLTALADELLLADPDGPQRRLLVVVDQFEELLTQSPPSQRARFAELLCPASTGPKCPTRVVATLRPEFVDQVLADPELAVLPTRFYPLRPLGREALRLVIEGPARLVGIKVSADLVARLVEDTDSGEALPLLAFTLAQLAEGVHRGGRLSIARYEQLGGVSGALARQADIALVEAVGAGGRDREEVIAGLLRLVTVDEQGAPTRWRVRRDELPAPVVTEWDAFVGRRLLSTDTDNGAVVIGVAHEAFLSAWPPLAQAITANVTALRARRAVEHAATEWDGNGRLPTLLWSGGELAAAVTDTGARICAGSPSPPVRRGPARWLPRRHQVLVTNRVELSTQARDFLHAGIRRDRSRRRRATTVLSVAIIVALVAVGFAFDERRNAERGERIATADRLVGDAEATRSTDLRAALLLGLAAHRLHPTAGTHSSLVNTLAAGPYLGTLTGHTSSVNSVAFAPDGHTLATGSEDSTVILWDLNDPVASRRLGQPLTGHSKPVNSVAFTPDGRTLAIGSEDSTVILWDVTDRTQPRRLGSPLTGHTGAVTAMALAPDGRTLITGSADRTVIRWDLTDLAQPRQLGSPLTGHAGAVSSVTLASDGHTLATGDGDGAVILWDVTDRAQPRQLGPLLNNVADRIVAVTFAPGGRVLATSTVGDTVLWDLTDPAQPHPLGPALPLAQPLVSQASLVLSVAFAPDGRTLATSTHTGATVLWDVTNPAQPRPLGPPLTGHTSEVNAVAFAPDGRTLTTGSADGTVILWDLADPVQPQLLGPPLVGHDDWVWSVAFAPDGRTLATGSIDRTVILWDVTGPARPRRLDPPLTGHSNSVVEVAFNPDGRTLATGSEDGTVILWDVTDPAQPRRLEPPLTDHTGRVNTVAFTHDGRSLATGGSDRTVILWDVTDPAQPHPLGPPLTGHTGSVVSVVFSPDGRSVVTGSVDATAIRWDVSDPTRPRQLRPPLTGHTGRVNSVAFSSDGRTVATSSDDNTVILWDVTDPAQHRRFGPPLPSNTTGVTSVAFSPDGRTLAAGSSKGTVILWDVTDPAHPRRLPWSLASQTLAVLSVAFSPDGRTLATGNFDSTATLWDITSFNQLLDHAVERACAITRGGLDRAEWDRYLPRLPYQDSCPG
ncbi:MAG: nSTAND1 domain-containing NTPase [Pseudonocardiales bacterium]